MNLFRKKSKFDEQIAECDKDHKRLGELQAQVEKLTPEWEKQQLTIEDLWLRAFASGQMANTLDPNAALRLTRVAEHSQKLKKELASVEQKRDSVLVPIDAEIKSLNEKIWKRNLAFISSVKTWLRKIQAAGIDEKINQYLNESAEKLEAMRTGSFKDLVAEVSEIASRLENEENAFTAFSLDFSLVAPRKTVGFPEPELVQIRTDRVATIEPTPGQKPILR